MKVKVNRKHFININNIDKILPKNNICWIYQKIGYPKILKTDCDFHMFLLRGINSGFTRKQIEQFKEDTNYE